MPDSSRRAADVLRLPGLVRFLSARVFAVLAAQIQTVAVGWQIYDITHDPLDLGLIGLSQFLPFVLLILPAGQIADRYDRRRIVTLCYAAETICAMLLLGFTLKGVTVAWPVFGAMVLLGCARAFSMPSGQALLPNLVPPDSFTRAVALNSSIFQIANIVGPAIGGLLYAGGPAFVYSTVVVLAAAAVILMYRVGPEPKKVRAAEPANWNTLLSGLRFVWTKPVVLGAISLDLFAVLFGGAVALLPVFARDILHSGPVQLGLLRAAPGAGAAVCAILLAANPMKRHVGAWMFGGVAVFGAATIVFGMSSNGVISMIALATLGAADMVSVYIRHLLVQLETPDYLRGRVSAVSSVFIGASNELGEFESGVTAKWLGTVRAVVVGGIATLVVTGVWTKLFPQLRYIQTFPEPIAKRADEVEAKTSV
jgi:MFS family permease